MKRTVTALLLLALLLCGCSGGQKEPPYTVDQADAILNSGAFEGSDMARVDGAVAAPGVYELAEDARVDDAVAAAGGLLSEADTSTINLAAPVSDGAKVHIPTSEELSAGAQGASGESGNAGAPAGSASSAPTLANINTATSEELQRLSGVGEATAAAIIEDRQANGPFSSPEDLMRVSGIGEKKFAKIKAHICV